MNQYRDPVLDGSPQIAEDAARWFRLLQEPAVSWQTLSEWQDWLKASAGHRRVYEEIENAVRRMDRLPLKPLLPSAEEMSRDTYDGSVPISEWQRVTQAKGSTLIGSFGHALRSYGKRASVKRLAIAAGLASLVLSGGWVWVQHERAAQLGEFVYETAAGMHRVVELPDGSRITLDADSALSVRLTAGQRALMLERGEAFFQVAKDTKRPFVVRAGSAQVTAIGTAFNVRMSENRTVVAVTEGKVEFVAIPKIAEVSQLGRAAVSSQAPAGTRPKLQAQVAAGEGVSYADDGNLQALPARVAPLATSWLEGRRQYRKEPLRYVLADVDRYTGQKIELGDDAVGDLEFTGTLNLKNSEAWFRGLSVALPVSVMERDDGVVLIKRK
jgi:transmembrane sensor